MEDVKKATTFTEVIAKPELLDLLESVYHDYIILQDKLKVNSNNGKSKKNKKSEKKKGFVYNSSIKTLNVKFYAEQLAHHYMSESELAEYLKDMYSMYQYFLKNHKMKLLSSAESHEYDYLFERFFEEVVNFDKEFEVICIKHDKDKVANEDDFFELSEIKPHIHLVIKRKNGKSFRANTVLDKLGICFRRYIDNELWVHAVATCGSFQASVAYLTHETINAQAEGKTLYPREEIISNCSTAAIDDFRNGYMAASEQRKLTALELVNLDNRFYEWGYELKDYNQLYDSLSFFERSNCKIRTIKESYERGFKARIEADPPYINRTCIFVEGGSDKGKTYALNHALQDLGYKVYEITGGGTGKFDSLRVSHTAISIDDETCPNLLNMTDSRVTTAYKRQSNNPYWMGNVFVVTSNKKFLHWCEDSGLKVTNFQGGLNEHAYAMLSRFLVYKVKNFNGTNQIVPSNDYGYKVDLNRSIKPRGTQNEINEKLATANKIVSIANSYMKDYKPSTTNVKGYNDFYINVKGQKVLYSDLLKEYMSLQDLYEENKEYFYEADSSFELSKYKYLPWFDVWLAEDYPEEEELQKYIKDFKKFLSAKIKAWIFVYKNLDPIEEKLYKNFEEFLKKQGYFYLKFYEKNIEKFPFDKKSARENLEKKVKKFNENLQK